jgi:hypothetical protein
VPSWTITNVPTGAISLNSLAANMGIRTHPWLAGLAGTDRLPWMATPPLK